MGIQLAWKRRYDLAISVVKNSVAQIAAFLYPALVLISLFFTQRLTFGLPNTGLVLVVALVFAALAIWQITGDGEAAGVRGHGARRDVRRARHRRLVRMTESVRDYPRPPRVEPCPRRILVVLGGETIVDSTRTQRVLETSHPPVYYVPLEDVASDVLEPSGGRTLPTRLIDRATTFAQGEALVAGRSRPTPP